MNDRILNDAARPGEVIDPFRLDGRTALITGATGGIGEAAARLFARAGASLVLTSNEGDRCAALAEELHGRALPADLADQAAVHAMAGAAGPIDILVCNGGIEGHVGPLGTASAAAIERLFAVNLYSALTLTGALAPAMAARGGGSIVLVASIAGLRGNKAIGLYGIAKAGLAQLARNLAVEWGPQGVRVNTISPGLIATPFARPILEDPHYLPRRIGLTPLRRAGEAGEIAASILYLASDAAGFVTGHNLVADGGTTISDGN
ncbi:MAG TPA: SDR family oxidoreductase [Sphingomonas sp.]|jgi:NAD(P)-dependent dehydrogenase (short-subunit alcohol dehydrogenase family)|uniref:SDR family NAD(P)-dependent oxidoreductase n=1 Tax=Sphingomonas sp. TaxID=28214 RepID=UPI002ED83D27